MSTVPVMITGVLWDHAWKSGTAVTLMGEANIVGLGVGGGPIIPSEPPLGIWGPTDPRPTTPGPVLPARTQNPAGLLGPARPTAAPPLGDAAVVEWGWGPRPAAATTNPSDLGSTRFQSSRFGHATRHLGWTDYS